MLFPVIRVRDAYLGLDQVAEFVAAFEKDATLDALGDDIDKSRKRVFIVAPYCLFFFWCR